MKKFTQLPIGESFEYQGEQYLKVGPLIGRKLATGQQRMIPRSALVAPLGTTADSETDTAPSQRQLPEAQVLEAFENYHKGCLEWLLLTEETDSALAQRIREAMKLARERFIQDLQRL